MKWQGKKGAREASWECEKVGVSWFYSRFGDVGCIQVRLFVPDINQ